MRISDWSSDVCSSDLGHDGVRVGAAGADRRRGEPVGIDQGERHGRGAVTQPRDADPGGICKAPGNRKINARKDCRQEASSLRPILSPHRIEIVESLEVRVGVGYRSEEHTYELQSLIRIS